MIESPSPSAALAAPRPAPSARCTAPRLALAGARTLAAVASLMQALALPAHADAPTPIPMQQLMELARGGAAALPADARIEIEPGQLDPRLKLAPCRRIEPYLPTGSTAWGRTRVGLRCTDGPVNWNVFLPVTVRVWSPAVVNVGPLQAGAEIRAEDLQIREVDIASAAAPVFRDPQLLVGRLLAATLPPGTPLRPQHLRVRQWFAAGETVTLVYVGEGFSASTEAQALSNGLDGQSVRVRTPSGKIVTGRPVGERRVEVRS